MAHEKVYAICEDKCREETMTKEAITAQDAEFLGEAKKYAGIRIETIGIMLHDGASALKSHKDNIAAATTLDGLKETVCMALDIIIETFNEVSKIETVE